MGLPEITSTANGEIIGRVISVNVGQPQWLTWQGNAVKTSFRKSAVSGRVAIVGGRLEGDRPQLDGDSVSDPEVHGGVEKCVFVYSHEHFSFWEGILNRMIAPGFFGENLTLEGIDEESVAIGDVVRIGSSIFRVSEPRQPCYKVDVSLGRHGAAIEMVKSGRIGFYLALVEPGTVGAGDAVERIVRQSERWITPSLMHKINSSATLDDLGTLDRLIASDVILDWWRNMFQVKREAIVRRAARLSPDSWSGTRDFTVMHRRAETANVVSLWLKPVLGRLPEVRGGQFVAIELPNSAEPDQAHLVRCYSISDIRHDAWRITVRCADNSSGGSLAVWKLAVGDTVKVFQPSGTFCLDTRKPCDVFLLSGGIGITPMITLVKEWIARGQPGKLTALHTMRVAHDNALVAELAALIEPLESANLYVNISNCDQSEVGPIPGADVTYGRITPQRIAQVLRHPTTDTIAYVCGPTGLFDMASIELAKAGLAPSNILTEAFVAGGAAELTAVPIDGLEVMFAQLSRTALWASAETTLLELADSVGIEIPASCRQGVCGTCLTRILDGQVIHIRKPGRPLDKDQCLPCIAVPSARLLLDC